MRYMTGMPAVLLLASTTALAAQASDQGAFVVTLGKDTIVFERYARSGAQIEGDMLLRNTGAVVLRHYAGTLNADGSMATFEMTNRPAATPQARGTRFVARFGDTTVVDVTRDTATSTLRVPTPGGALPFLNFSYAMYELFGRRALATHRDTITTLPLGAGEITPLVVGHPAANTLTVGFLDDAPTRFGVDADGRILSADGSATTQKVQGTRVASLDFAALTAAFQNRPLGQLSPPDSVRATIGGASIAIDYSRPGMRGRTIFGGIIPWGQVWRTGANAATRITTSADLMIGGQRVPAGSYTLWTLPAASGWKLIVNKQTKAPCTGAAECTSPTRARLWGTDYDADSDFVRIDMQATPLDAPVEQFAITVEPQGAGAVMAFTWEKTRVWVNLAKP